MVFQFSCVDVSDDKKLLKSLPEYGCAGTDNLGIKHCGSNSGTTGIGIVPALCKNYSWSGTGLS